MKIKTADLIGAALDWAVCYSMGAVPRDGLTDDERFSTNRDQGYALVEQNDISIRRYHNPESDAHGRYYARVSRESTVLVGWHSTTGFQQMGPTPLIAAMRCFVAMHAGDSVDVPEQYCVTDDVFTVVAYNPDNSAIWIGHVAASGTKEVPNQAIMHMTASGINDAADYEIVSIFAGCHNDLAPSAFFTPAKGTS